MQGLRNKDKQHYMCPAAKPAHTITAGHLLGGSLLEEQEVPQARLRTTRACDHRIGTCIAFVDGQAEVRQGRYTNKQLCSLASWEMPDEETLFTPETLKPRLQGMISPLVHSQE